MAKWISLTTAALILLAIAQTEVSSQKTFQFDVAWTYRALDCVNRPVTVINGKAPGPTIRAKAGELLIIKVSNYLSSDAITIHWHGQRQYKTVWQDGIGMISNCPIPPQTSFTYRFIVNDQPGTYFYHGHMGGIRAAGLYGMLIIDPVLGKEEQWTYDAEHSLLLSDWYHASPHELAVGLLDQSFRSAGNPQSVLINGKGYYNCSKKGVPLDNPYPYYKPGSTTYCSDNNCPEMETIEVAQNKTYRIRLGNIAERSFLNIAIQDHNMTVIEADGQPMVSMTVRSLEINSGQRYSVLITTNQPVGLYWISIKTRLRKTVLVGQAILKYTGASGKVPTYPAANISDSQPAWDDITFSFQQQNGLKGKTIAPSNDKVKRRIIMVGTQERFEMNQRAAYNDRSQSRPEDNCNATGRYLRWAINGASYVWENTPVVHMAYYGLRTNTFTENRGYYKINNGDVIDIVIQNYPKCSQVCEQHPWHLHGHKFWVVGMGKGTWNGNSSQIAMLNTQNAIYRDTTTVLPDARKPFSGQRKQGGCGWVVLRFIADNPGVWPFHCHITWHFVMGMQTVFIESMSDIPSPPSDVPICGDVTPNVYVQRNKLVSESKQDVSKEKNKIYLIALAVGWGLFIFYFILCIYLISKQKVNNDKSYSVKMSPIPKSTHASA